jgi:hypothetical protein
MGEVIGHPMSEDGEDETPQLPVEYTAHLFLLKNFQKYLFSVNPVNLLQLGIHTLNQFGKDKEENYDNQKTISKKQITVQGNFPGSKRDGRWCKRNARGG